MSNKTPAANAKKTKSAPKFKSPIFIGILIAVVFAVVGFFVVSQNAEEPANPAASFVSDQVTPQEPTPVCENGLLVRGACLKIEAAKTPEARTQGLSGREGLAADTAMLFYFDEPGQQCFWMKDMKFAIDMVWLDEDKRVLKVAENVSPQTYPESFCQANAQYVAEVPAGQAQKYNLEIGQQVEFQ